MCGWKGLKLFLIELVDNKIKTSIQTSSAFFFSEIIETILAYQCSLVQGLHNGWDKGEDSCVALNLRLWCLFEFINILLQQFTEQCFF